jgi:hypothetical protein
MSAHNNKGTSDFSISIEHCTYALNVLEQRIELLDSLLGKINNNNKQKEQLFKCKEFYHKFQECYDLYFFVYLGHFIRKEHYQNQKSVHYKALREYCILRNNNGRQDYAWNCSASYLSFLV